MGQVIAPLFGGGRRPEPQIIPAPRTSDAEIQAAAAEAARRRNRARGYRSTILSDMTSSPSGALKTTLGS